MIESTKRFIQIARRQVDELWKFEQIDNSGSLLFIRTIKYDLLLEEIYHGTGL